VKRDDERPDDLQPRSLAVHRAALGVEDSMLPEVIIEASLHPLGKQVRHPVASCAQAELPRGVQADHPERKHKVCYRRRLQAIPHL